MAELKQNWIKGHHQRNPSGNGRIAFLVAIALVTAVTFVHGWTDLDSEKGLNFSRSDGCIFHQ